MRPAAANRLERDLRRRLGYAVVRFDVGTRAAVFRSDLPELLPRNVAAGRLSQQTLTLAELLSTRAPIWPLA
jgi:hypothetical protein